MQVAPCSSGLLSHELLRTLRSRSFLLTAIAPTEVSWASRIEQRPDPVAWLHGEFGRDDNDNDGMTTIDNLPGPKVPAELRGIARVTGPMSVNPHNSNKPPLQSGGWVDEVGVQTAAKGCGGTGSSAPAA